MEVIAGDVERGHLGVADLDALLVGPRVERALDLQAGLGRRRGNQLDDGHEIRERFAAPVLRDVAEQAMLDLVPLGRARRIVADLDRHDDLVGELLRASTFHSLERALLEPPQSAVIISSRMLV